MSSKYVKSSEEISVMRESGKILARVLSEVSAAIRPGITPMDLERLANEIISSYPGAEPSFKGYNGFPAALCISRNHEIVHGIPNDIPFEDGDIVGIDCGVWLKKNGHRLCTDAAVTVPVGHIITGREKLLNVNKEALNRGISAAVPGAQVRQISKEIQKYTEENGYTVVRDLSGHGVGYAVHEKPDVMNWVMPGRGHEVLVPGMTLAIEPIIAVGSSQIRTLDDDWTIVTADGSLASQFEHTILITEDGAEILTEE